ncbi:carbohydrate kinase [Prochlorococcus marinus XMU1414]|uniref:Carbohydrate kinase n=1 Tax=Prochlorococcus marinus XMU1424 TaxID=2774497 RepID=A0A9D9C026_PROMR|nr:carbohydrate kinase [Prochlorococcus marinus]MBO8229076.1 carbohydrate kinase [Prochlorococcus marinus XMU1414]MBW3046533.1 carbohydrate kinase [Prochlorococcus marinus str. MU1414]MCR8533029.1 carbohydrate kinase [Prochlorococcus marinus XMU1420]MCR8536072.1 carbohydrate kinase [Prochlorococcus marinus XMU1424]
MKKKKVICIGEALIDRIRNKSNNGFTDFLGGAPANVACALRKLKIDSKFIGSLGNDDYGKKFISQFDQLGVNLDFLQLNNDSSTRVVNVDRDQFGDRFFSGFEKSSHGFYADEVLSKKLIEKEILNLEKSFLEIKYLVTGTNILSSPKSAETIFFLIEQAKKFEVKIVIDLNWREVFWDHSSFSSEISKASRDNLIKNFLNHANVLKLAKEEAALFFENENPLIISQRLSNRPDVIITDGKNPVLWSINGFQGITETPTSQKIVDTTGAGDAFLAGFISKLISSGYPTNDLEIEDCIKFAGVCGLLTCLGEGAIEQQPDYEKVNKFLGSLIS